MTLPPLTPMQAKVAERLAKGLSYRDAGAELGIASGTVRAHAVAITYKLDNPHKLGPQSLIRVTFGKAA